MADAHKNLAYSTVLTAPSPATSGTSLVVQSGKGADFPAVPFNVTVWPAGAIPLNTNAEIVRVTAISTDTFTITRTQESTSARIIVVGDQIAASITAKTLKDIEDSVATTATPQFASLTLSANGGKTTLALTDTTANVGLTIGADTNLFRAGADTLKTDDNLTVAGSLTIQGSFLNVPGGSSIVVGGDANLYRSGTNTLKTDSLFRVASSFVSAVSALTDAATIATDASLGNLFTVTIAASRAMGAPTNPTDGQSLTYRIKQGGVGSFIITWNGVFRFSGGTAPTLTTTAAKTDYIEFIYNATDTKWDCINTKLNL